MNTTRTQRIELPAHACLPGVLLLMLAVASTLSWGPDAVRASDVLAGTNMLVTPAPGVGQSSASFIDFAPNPLASGFFGTGSDEFASFVELKGSPLSGTNLPPLTDTIITRLQDAILPNEYSSSVAVDIQVTAMQLVSVDDIVVLFNGATSYATYQVSICLSAGTTQPTGHMTIHHRCPEGGRFDSYLPVVPRIQFTQTGGNAFDALAQVTLDPAPQVELVAVNGWWSHTDAGFGAYSSTGGVVDATCQGSPDVSYGATSNFFPGVCWLLCDGYNTPSQARKRVTSQVGSYFSQSYLVSELAYPDSDGDGIDDLADNCPYIPNSLQSDFDDDTVGDACDNCLELFNPFQEDSDSNGIGDACDGQCTADTCATPYIISALPFVDAGSTCACADDYDQVDGQCPSSNAPDLVYAYTPLQNECVNIALCDSAYDSKVWVYQDQCPDTGNAIACNDDACGISYVQSAIYGLNLLAGHTYYIVIDGYGTDCGDYVLDVTTCLTPPANDNCANADGVSEITDLPFTIDGATADGPGTCITGPDIWYLYTASCDGVVTVDTCGSSFDTMLAVFEGSDCFNLGTELACVDDSDCDGDSTPEPQSRLSFTAVAGNSYMIQVGDFAGAGGAGDLTISCSSTGDCSVAAGLDLWMTPPGGSSYEDFAATPIPADFFGPGSDPFDGQIALAGSPLPSNGGPSIAPADTIIERLDTAILTECINSDTVPIVIRALSLVAPNPITITYNGGQNPESWNVSVCLSDETQPTGSMTIQPECLSGGSFVADLPVLPKFVFTRVSDSMVVEFDFGVLGLSATSFSYSDGHWVYVPDSMFNVIAAPPGVLVDANCDGIVEPPLSVGTSDFAAGVWDQRCEPGAPPHALQVKRLCPFTAADSAHGMIIAQSGTNDADGDLILDDADNCPAMPNPLQADTDADGVGDECDNCPTRYNPFQEDADQDNVGDICQPPGIISAISRKTHGTVGAFDIDVHAVGAVEGRQEGPTTLVVTFDQPISLASGTNSDVTLSSGTVTTLSVVGNELTIHMSGATPREYLRVELPGIADTDSNPVAEHLCVGALLGDVSQVGGGGADGVVNIYDLIYVKGVLDRPVTASTFRGDIAGVGNNPADGLINIYDLIAIKGNLDRTLNGSCP